MIISYGALTPQTPSHHANAILQPLKSITLPDERRLEEVDVVDDLKVVFVVVCISYVTILAVDKLVLLGNLLSLPVLKPLDSLGDSNTQNLAATAGSSISIEAVGDLCIRFGCS